jgi:hypothetical protein
MKANPGKRELLCEYCLADYPVWFTPNKFWNKVIRREDGTDRWQFLCPSCFANLAERMGIVPTAWMLTTEEAHKQEVEEARRELAIQVSKALFRNGIELNVASKILADSGIPSALERSGDE